MLQRNPRRFKSSQIPLDAASPDDATCSLVLPCPAEFSRMPSDEPIYCQMLADDTHTNTNANTNAKSPYTCQRQPQYQHQYQYYTKTFPKPIPIHIQHVPKAQTTPMHIAPQDIKEHAFNNISETHSYFCLRQNCSTNVVFAAGERYCDF